MPTFPATTLDFFLHNWADNCVLSTEFLTDETASFNSLREERRGLLDHPIRSMTCTWFGVSRDQTNRMLMHVARGESERSLVPIYPDVSVLTALSNGTTINCDTTLRRFQVGQQCVVFSLDADGRPTNAQVFLIDALAAGAITTHTVIVGNYAAGSSYCVPLLYCEIRLSQDTQLMTDFHATLKLAFDEVADTAYAASALVGAPGAFGTQTSTADGTARPIFLPSVHFSSQLKVALTRAGNKFASGLTEIVSPQGPRPAFGWTIPLLLSTRADVWAAQNFFDSRLGRLVPFWLVNPVTLWNFVGSNGLTYVDVSVSGNITDPQAFIKYLAVQLIDGTTYIAPVTSVTLVGGNWRLAAVLPGFLNANVRRVTSAHLARFAKDSIDLSYVTDGVVTSQLDIIELYDEVSTAPFSIPPCGVFAGWLVGIVVFPKLGGPSLFEFAVSTSPGGSMVTMPAHAPYPALGPVTLAETEWAFLSEDADYYAVYRIVKG